jgi:hypothetical protein
MTEKSSRITARHHDFTPQKTARSLRGTQKVSAINDNRTLSRMRPLPKPAVRHFALHPSTSHRNRR